MRRIKDFLHGLKFSSKLRLIFSVVVFVPMIAIGAFVFISSSRFIREQQVAEVEDTIERNVLDLDNRIVQCESSLRYLSSNYSLQEFLNSDRSNYLDISNKAKNVGPLVYNTLLSNQSFNKIQLYTDNNYVVLDSILKTTEDISEQSWYQDTITNDRLWWWFEDGEIFLTRRITNSYPEKVLGVIRVDIKEEMLLDSFESFLNTPVYIQLKKDEMTVYDYENGKESSIQKTAFVETRDLQMTGYRISYGVSEDNFTPYFHPRVVIAMLLIIILLIMVFIAINLSSRSLLKHLYLLIDDVRQLRKGDFEVEIDTSAADEIGDLARSIDKMAKKINMLIEEVYKNEIEKKNLELNLLQSKISPHFLYNNLSAINWIAIEKEEYEIHEITTQMATFYRTALNKGVNIDKLRVEVDNIKAYIKLQLFAHEHSFEVDYEIDNSLLDLTIPLFVMQPIVENAIEHGIDQLREEHGKLRICIYAEEEVLYIEVCDNGTALFNRLGNAILPTDEYGYGISNVHKRIQLLYGEKYGVAIHADSEGTKAKINLKIDRLS